MAHHDHDPTVATLVAEITELRAALAEQQRINAQQSAINTQQQEAISALQQGLRAVPPDPRAAAVMDADASLRVTSAAEPLRGKGTSRRGLLRGAAAGAAAAAVAAVAVGGTEQAHAAPLATGDNFILGANNNANATTTLAPTSGSTPGTLLYVDNGTNTGNAIRCYSQAYSGAIFAQGVSAGTGVYALADTGYGVYAASGTGVAIYGLGVASNPGIYGTSNSGSGVVGFSGAGVAINAIGTGRIAQSPQSTAGAPTGTGTTYAIGEQIRDSNGELWLCVASGAPGTWVRVAHTPVGYSGGVTAYLSKPIRLLDTRGGDSLAWRDGGGPIAGGSPAGAPYPLTIAGVSWQSVTVPASAVGAIGNVTAVAGSGGGYLAIVPHGAGFSGTATLAYGPNQVVSNAFTTGLGSGQLDILIGGSATDVILDLVAVVA